MRIFHGDLDNAKAMLLGEFADFGGVIVGQHSRAAHLAHKGEKPGMVDFVVHVKASAGFFPTGRIRWIDKKECAWIFGKAADDVEGVAMLKRNAVFQTVEQVRFSVAKVCGIPTRMQSAARFARFH